MSAAVELIDALGGRGNIRDIEPCALRIRVEVDDQAAVEEAALRLDCVLAVVRSGDVVQIVAGLASDAIADEMRRILDGDAAQ